MTKVFYVVFDTNVLLSKDGAFVVTGNQRHFPKNPIVVSPVEMIRIVEGV